MTLVLSKTAPDMVRLIAATGHHAGATIDITEAETVDAEGWSEGGKTDAYIVDPVSYTAAPVTPRSTFAPFANLAYKPTEIPQGCIAVSVSVFQGKAMAPRVIMPVGALGPWQDARICTEFHTDCAASPELAHACNTARGVKDENRPTKREREILDAFSWTAKYRRECLARMGANATECDTLICKGWLKRNKAGAMAVTPEGKVARSMSI